MGLLIGIQRVTGVVWAMGLVFLFKVPRNMVLLDGMEFSGASSKGVVKKCRNQLVKLQQLQQWPLKDNMLDLDAYVMFKKIHYQR